MRHKYHAKRCEFNGIKFPSQKEGRRYQELVLLQRSGEVVMFLRQPLFDLGGGTTYKADYLIFWKDGTCTVEDVKGFKTKSFIKAKKQVECLYPVIIKVI